MKGTTIIVQIVNAAILAFLFYGGPPMGESELAPWDVLAIVSSLVVVVLCPSIYICIWKRRRWPRVSHVAAVVLLSASSLLTLALVVLLFQWPQALSGCIWDACIHCFGKNA